jgi:integrase/recombinase XerD
MSTHHLPSSVLASWRLWQEAQGLAERTISERANVITHLLAFAGCGPLSLRPDDIIAFTARRDISATSRATYHASIRAYCVWLVRTKRRDDDPSVDTPRPRRPKARPRPLHDAQLEALLDQANRRRTRMMILLAALAGLRVHEIAKVRGEDLDRVIGALTVTGKGGKTAIIPAHEMIVAEASHFPRQGPWFPAYNGREHILPGSVSSAIQSTMRRAGVVGKPHQLRHWYGTTLLAAGVDVRVVQELMRHENLATTAIYTQVDDAQRRAGLALLSLPKAA